MKPTLTIPPHRRRAGSILILVVVLLVLLALVGTAYLSSTAIERFSTAQQADVTETELMLDGAVALNKALLVDGVFGGGFYRPANAGYARFTMAGTDENAYLAERTPTDDGGTVHWRAVTMPAMGNGGYTFETPDGWTLTFSNVRTLTAVSHNGGGNILAGQRAIAGFEPTSINGLPALAILENPGAGNQRISVTDGSTTTDSFLAADADGDGIADSLLMRFSPGPINGVTYYMAMRVIDAGSAINAGTAGSRTNDYLASLGNGADPLGRATNSPRSLGMFRSHVGLFEILPSPPEMTSLYAWRNNGQANANLNAFGDNATQRSDFGYATQGQAWEFQLARRLRNPGYYNASTRYRAFGTDVASSLAYHGGVMAHPELNRSTLELALLGSAGAWNAGAPRSAFAANDVSTWFNYYYNFTTGATSIRGLLTAFNPVSNQMPVNAIPGTANFATPNPRMVPYTGTLTIPYYAPRVNINTASFGEMWWGFYQAMADAPGVNPTAVAPAQFRSPTRDPADKADRKLFGLDVMLLRSALAAANAADLRDSDYNVSSFAVRLMNQANSGQYTYEYIVHGYEPAPFITEVFVDANRRPLFGGAINPRGYVAVELHNPYDFDIELSGYSLGIVDRRASGATPGPKYDSATPNWLYFMDNAGADGITGFKGFAFDGSAPVVPAHGYLVLENFNGGNAADEAALARPFANGVTGANFVYVKNLHKVIRNDNAGEEGTGGELYLLRPRAAGVDTTTRRMRCPGWINGTMQPAGVAFNEGVDGDYPNLEDLVPVDSVDFSPLTQMATAVPAQPEGVWRWHGVRRNDPAAAGVKWKFVYPGPYRVNPPANGSREMYIKVDGYSTDDINQPGAALPDATTFTPPLNLGGSDTDYHDLQRNLYPAVQLQPTGADLNTQFAGPKKPTGNSGNQFPFGGFMRDGDILQTPFAGAYTVRRIDATTGGTLAANPAFAPGDRKLFLECNPLPKDLFWARFDDPLVEDALDEHQAEQLGRFCPIRYPVDFGVAATIDDFHPNTPAPRVRWAADLFEYLTVDSPAMDTMPDISPYATATGAAVTPAPAGVANADSWRTNGGLENLVGLEGKININTASWKVLSALPLSHANTRAMNEEVARAIVAWRESNGPFKTLMDLNAVWNGNANPALARSFRSGWRLSYDPTDPNNADRESADPANDAGDFAPYNGSGTDAGDGVTKDPDGTGPVGPTSYQNWDFERQFLQITRLSNLLTVRSDTFNCYVQVQGWRNVGMTTPGVTIELATQRRAAFIGDRTGTTVANRKLNVIGVPAN